MLYSTKKENIPSEEIEQLAKELFGSVSANWKRNRRIDLISEKREHLQRYISILKKHNSNPTEIIQFFKFARTGDEAKKSGRHKEFMNLNFPSESILFSGETGSCKSSFLQLVYDLLKIKLRQINRLRNYAMKTDREYWTKKLSLLLKEHSVMYFAETDLRTVISKAVKWPTRENENEFYSIIDRMGEVNYIIIDEMLYNDTWTFPAHSASEYSVYFKIYSDALIRGKHRGKIFLASSNNLTSDLSVSVPIVRRITEIFDRTVIMSRKQN